jgi:hypothetical protein
MTNSPFAENANALLTFKVGTGLFRRDETTGNQDEIYGTLEVSATLSQSENPVNVEMFGPDRTRMLLKGYAVDPQYLPHNIQVGTPATCALVDLYTGAEIIGEFRITSLLQSQFPQVTEVMGSQIQGWFTVDNAGEVLHET